MWGGESGGGRVGGECEGRRVWGRGKWGDGRVGEGRVWGRGECGRERRGWPCEDGGAPWVMTFHEDRGSLAAEKGRAGGRRGGDGGGGGEKEGRSGRGKLRGKKRRRGRRWRWRRGKEGERAGAGGGAAQWLQLCLQGGRQALCCLLSGGDQGCPSQAPPAAQPGARMKCPQLSRGEALGSAEGVSWRQWLRPRSAGP